MRRLSRFAEFIDKNSDLLGKFTLYPILLIMCQAVLEVVLRYCFARPTLWVWVMNRQFLLLITCLAAAYSFRHGYFVRLDLFTKRFTGRFKVISDIWSFLFTFIFSAVVLWQGAIYFWNSLVARELFIGIWKVPIYPIKFFVPVVGLLLILQAVANFIRDIIPRWRREIVE